MASRTSAEMEADNKTALTSFVMDNEDLVKLEGLLGRFNIFRVLRAARNEIRHSNMLAWLLDPAETHGLGDRFVRRWLMEVVHGAMGAGGDTNSLPSPIEVDVLDIEYVEVARESANIDLLLLISTGKKTTWVVCIENKVESVQGKKQLEGYRAHVERKYPSAERTLFVFLTKNDEEPDDPKWISSTYGKVEGVLRRCLDERGDAVGHEPHLLMKQYLNLLAEDFVEENESTELARKIYQRHKKAIDFILETRQDPISDASSAMEEVLRNSSSDLGISLSVQSKGWIRFIPKEWDIPANHRGNAWGQNSPFALCEISLWTKKAELQVTFGQAPENWVDKAWDAVALPKIRQRYSRPGSRPKKFVKPYKAPSDISVESLSELEPDELKKRLLDWIKNALAEPKFKHTVETVARLLPKIAEV